MGACFTKQLDSNFPKSNKNPQSPSKDNDKYIFITKDSIYGIQQFGMTIIPIDMCESPLKFEFRISDVKGKNLPDYKVRNITLYN